MEINTGGPAFPAQFYDERATGMTLRDYFAAKAMQALVDESHNHDMIRAIAMTAYDIADAMLEARK